jgi:hypothetical protein
MSQNMCAFAQKRLEKIGRIKYNQGGKTQKGEVSWE